MWRSLLRGLLANFCGTVVAHSAIPDDLGPSFHPDATAPAGNSGAEELKRAARLLRAEEAIAGVPQPGEDIAVRIEAAVERRRNDPHVGKDARKLGDAFRGGNQADELDPSRREFLEARDRGHRGVPPAVA